MLWPEQPLGDLSLWDGTRFLGLKVDAKCCMDVRGLARTANATEAADARPVQGRPNLAQSADDNGFSSRVIATLLQKS